MTAASYLSRIRLRQDASAGALAPLLLPPDASPNATGHHLLWSLFADTPDRRRDFLWRELEGGGTRGAFLTLSARQPQDHHGLFEVETKPFEANLASGDRLTFSLRANPVVTRRIAPRRSIRADVVMDRLRHLPRGDRSEKRLQVAAEAGRAWVADQLTRHGARLIEPDSTLRVDGYEQVRLDRGRGRAPLRFSVLELDGLLEVIEPAPFLAAVHRGFGKAKAFGCGLMLVRRA